jgi:hypothetical protein
MIMKLGLRRLYVFDTSMLTACLYAGVYCYIDIVYDDHASLYQSSCVLSVGRLSISSLTSLQSFRSRL